MTQKRAETVKHEVECLIRLNQFTPVYEELLEFLFKEYLITKDELNVIRNSPEKAKLMQAKLRSLSQDRRLQLLEFEWTILPVERIRITIVTDREHKEIFIEV